MNQEQLEKKLKPIIDALIANGFKKDYYHGYYEKDGYLIKVTNSDNLETIFAKLLNAGATLKIWEIKKVLQIVDPMI